MSIDLFAQKLHGNRKEIESYLTKLGFKFKSSYTYFNLFKRARVEATITKRKKSGNIIVSFTTYRGRKDSDIKNMLVFARKVATKFHGEVFDPQEGKIIKRGKTPLFFNEI